MLLIILQENEQLRESKREMDEIVVDIRTELDSKEASLLFSYLLLLYPIYCKEHSLIF